MNTSSKMRFRNLTIRSNKPGVFQSQTMSALEFGGTGCEYLEVQAGPQYIQVDAIFRTGTVIRTSLFNREDIAEVYGDRQE